MPTLDKLLDRLWQSPVGQQLLADEVDAANRERVEHIKALAELEKTALKKMPALIAARTAADERRKAALEAVRAATAEFNVAHSEVQSLSARTDAERLRHEFALSQSAPPEIDALVDRLTAEAERLRREAPTRVERRSTHLRNLGERLVFSNRAQIVTRLKAVQNAVEIVQSLKYENIEPGKLEQQLNAIWAALPDTALAESTK